MSASDWHDAFMAEFENYGKIINGTKTTFKMIETMPYDDKIYKIPLPTSKDENKSLMRFAKGLICYKRS